MFKNKIKSKSYQIYKNNFGAFLRLSSKPFVSGDTFRNNCNHVFDEVKQLKIQNIKFNDFVFVKSDYLDLFFNDIHPQIEFKYNLISHNSDEPIDIRYKKYVDEKIINWFAQNIEDQFSEKLKFIPIGLENRWHLNNGKVNNFKKILTSKSKKQHLIHSSFSTSTHPSRSEILEILNSNAYIVFNQNKKNLEYLNLLSTSYFNVCPRGNGWDTHRIWESLIFKTIPIVKKNKFTKNLIKQNIPVMVIDDWKNLNEYSENELIDFYNFTTNKQDISKYSSFEYWNKIINFNN